MVKKLEKVLIVDDEECHKELIRHTIKKFGCTYNEASNVDECRNHLNLSEYDLLIIDNHMPAETNRGRNQGVEFIETIKTTKMYPHMTIILYSSSPDACNRAKELGVKSIEKDAMELRYYLQEHYLPNTQ